MPTSEIVNYLAYQNSTRYTTSAGSSYTAPFTISYTKKESGTDIIIQTTIPVRPNANGMFYFVDINGSKKTTGICSTYYPGGTAVNILQRWSGLGAGNLSITFGWQTANGSSDQAFSVLHPNNSDDGRNRQQGSNWMIYEVKGLQTASVS